MKMRSAIDAQRPYELPERHDPLYLMFDNDFHLGTATHWPEYLLYLLETDGEEKMQEIKNIAVPYNTVGLLEVKWTPLAGPNDDPSDPAAHNALALPEVNNEEDLLGKSWTYQLEIVRASDLPVFCDLAYVSYDFFGESFMTEAVQQTTFSPVFDYRKVHHVPCVTREFLDYLKGSIEMQIHVTQHIETPPDKISTENEIVVLSIQTGEAKGYEHNNKAKKPKSEAELRCEVLVRELSEVKEYNTLLTSTLQRLEAELLQVKPDHVSVWPAVQAEMQRIAAAHSTTNTTNGTSSNGVTVAGQGGVSAKLKDAQLIDSIVNR